MKRFVLAAAALTSVAVVGCGGSTDTTTLDALRIRVDPDRVSFGDVQVGTRSEAEVTVTSEAQSALSIRVEVSDDWDDAFDFSPSVLEIPAEGSRTLRVGFNPTRSGATQSNLRLGSADGQVQAKTIALSGTGAAGCEDLQVEPRRLAFGNGLLSTRKIEEVRLTNAGSAALSAVFDEGDNVGDCDGATGEVTDFCVAHIGAIGPLGKIEIEPQSFKILRVGFKAVVAGASSGFFTLRAQAGCPEVSVSLTGVGVESGLSCVPRVDFGTVFPGTCRTESVTCDNVANGPITITARSRRPGSAMAAALQVEPLEAAVTLQEGGAMDFDVTYCPQELGPLTAEVRVEQFEGPPADIEVEGRAGGPNIEVTPTALDFGEVSTLAPVRTSVMVHNAGFDDLTVSDVRFDTMDLTVDTTSFVLPAGASQSLTVELQAFRAGPIEALMTVVSNDRAQPEVAVPVVGQAVNLPSCTFLAQRTLEMGLVETGRSAVRNVLLENTGNSDCLVTGLRFRAGSDPEFYLPEPWMGSFRIGAGSIANIRVGYAPTSGMRHTARLEVGLSSRSEPFVEIPIEATTVPAGAYAYPQVLDFTEQAAACGARSRTVRVYNRTTGPFDVTQVALVSSSFGGFAVTPTPVPFTINGGAHADLTVTFDPPRDGRFANALRVLGQISGAPASVMVDLVGVRTSGPMVQEDFQQVSGQPTDLLYVIDWSSAAQSQRIRPVGLGPLTQPLDAAGVSWRIGVITSDDGRSGELVGDMPADRIVSGDTPGASAAYDRVLNTVISGSGGTGSFSHLSSLEHALSAPTAVGYNMGIIRPEARLGVIFVARNRDFSSRAVDFYLDHLHRLKGYARRNEVAAHAIAGPLPTGCRDTLFAQAGPRFDEMVRKTGGIFESYCQTDLAVALASMSLRSAGHRDSFFLKDTPADGALEVFVDGVAVPAASPTGGINYSLDTTLGALVFAPASQPDVGAEISIRYVPACP